VSIINDEVQSARSRSQSLLPPSHQIVSHLTVGRAIDLIQDNTSYHIVLEKGQPASRCCMVSSDWSQSGQCGACETPPCQPLTCPIAILASRMWNLTHGGA
jgi:hypothetical protein